MRKIILAILCIGLCLFVSCNDNATDTDVIHTTGTFKNLKTTKTDFYVFYNNGNIEYHKANDVYKGTYALESDTTKIDSINYLTLYTYNESGQLVQQTGFVAELNIGFENADESNRNYEFKKAGLSRCISKTEVAFYTRQ